MHVPFFQGTFSSSKIAVVHQDVPHVSGQPEGSVLHVPKCPAVAATSLSCDHSERTKTPLHASAGRNWGSPAGTIDRKNCIVGPSFGSDRHVRGNATSLNSTDIESLLVDNERLWIATRWPFVSRIARKSSRRAAGSAASRDVTPAETQGAPPAMKGHRSSLRGPGSEGPGHLHIYGIALNRIGQFLHLLRLRRRIDSDARLVVALPLPDAFDTI